MNNSEKPLRIDIVSDVVCPWCIIGYRQLAEALKATNTAHEIHWRPFELNPDMPPEGQNLRDHLTEKYGISAKESEENRRNITERGVEVGFEFRFSDDLRMHNTFKSHQLLYWARQHGRMHELKLALFSAHFTKGRDLSDDTVLADIAAEIGLDRAEALTLLEDQRFATDVRDAQRISREQGIQGVPAMIFNDRHLVTGAQGVENYRRILGQLAEIQEQ
jgi:predicted DsbA family dithiol-disulfide isomerase